MSAPASNEGPHGTGNKKDDELFRLLVESVRDYAIFVLDPDGKVLTWNFGARALTGYERQEILGKHFSIFYLREAIENRWPDRELALADKEGRFADEGWRVRKDGSTFWASVVITALRNSDGALSGFAKVTRDMTERRDNAERIQNLNRELRQKVSELDQSRRTIELRTLELQNISARVLQIQDEERRRVARELHDDVGQQLAGVKMLLAETPNAEAVQKAVDSAINSVRNLSYLLHPPLLDEAGLHAALHWLVDGMKTRSNIDVALSMRPIDFPRMNVELETAVFRVVQESLTNIYRHSESESARVEIDKQSEWVVIRIRDYGKGLPPSRIGIGVQLGVGIGGMRERIRQFGGDLTIANARPGTIVEARIPLLL